VFHSREEATEKLDPMASPEKPIVSCSWLDSRTINKSVFCCAGPGFDSGQMTPVVKISSDWWRPFVDGSAVRLIATVTGRKLSHVYKLQQHICTGPAKW